MIIRAQYENGVFKPLDDLKLAEGTLVKISVPAEAPPKRPKSVGMWADPQFFASMPA